MTLRSMLQASKQDDVRGYNVDLFVGRDINIGSKMTMKHLRAPGHPSLSEFSLSSSHLKPYYGLDGQPFLTI